MGRLNGNISAILIDDASVAAAFHDRETRPPSLCRLEQSSYKNGILKC